MDIYILRHGEAEPLSPKIEDATRGLTAGGKRDVRRVSKVAKNAKLQPDVILTSPLRRAHQTAAIAAKVLKAPMAESRNLLPTVTPEKLWKELGALKDVAHVMVVGHEPHLSHFAAFLLEAAVSIDLKKGALLHIRTAASLGKPRGTLQSLVTPRLAR
ncbi:MAG: phosphohistidine phosphatase SixA [Acidobacteriota bacterium]